MIGNDIVDLTTSVIGQGERRLRYLEKILTENEIQILDSLGNEDKWIWLLWSIKESVYKIIHRSERKMKYVPKSIQCIEVCFISHEEYYSKVVYNGAMYIAKSLMHDDYISTVATADSEDMDKIYHESFPIPKDDNQSEYLDNKVRVFYSNLINPGRKNLTIKRDKNGIPHLVYDEQEIGYLSFSHHGQFGAFAFILRCYTGKHPF